MAVSGGAGVSLNLQSKTVQRSFLAAALMLVAIIATLVCVTVSVDKREDDLTDFGIVIDAGSSGTRLHVYEWLDKAVPPDVVPATAKNHVESLRVRVPLGSFGEEPEGAVDVLKQLLDYAESVLPESAVGRTPIYAFGTAGMRKLEAEQQEAVWAVVRREIRARPTFMLHSDDWVRTLDGEEEAIFGWVTVNYQLGNLQSGAPTVGSIDMGGASTEVAFVPREGTAMPSEYVSRVSLFGYTHNVYRHSYHGWGANDAVNRINRTLAESRTDGRVLQPCYLTGFEETFQLEAGGVTYHLEGTGDGDLCLQEANAILFHDHAPCDVANCTFNGVYQPPLFGEFYGFSAMERAVTLFDLNETVSLDELTARARDFCGEPWREAREHYLDIHPDYEGYLKQFCFTPLLMEALLTRFGFRTDEHTVHYAQAINNINVDWALGAMVFEVLALGKLPAPQVELVHTVGGAFLLFTAILLMLYSSNLAYHTWLARKRQLRRHRVARAQFSDPSPRGHRSRSHSMDSDHDGTALIPAASKLAVVPPESHEDTHGLDLEAPPSPLLVPVAKQTGDDGL